VCVCVCVCACVWYGNTWAIPPALFRNLWIFMCEGSRVKMGYVTYGVGGKKRARGGLG
jgi:hypothetical protein